MQELKTDKIKNTMSKQKLIGYFTFSLREASVSIDPRSATSGGDSSATPKYPDCYILRWLKPLPNILTLLHLKVAPLPNILTLLHLAEALQQLPNILTLLHLEVA